MISPTPEVGSISNLLNCTRSIGSPKVANDNLSNGPSAIKQSSVSVSTTVTSTASGLDNIDSQPVMFGSDKLVTNQNEPPAPQVSIANLQQIYNFCENKVCEGHFVSESAKNLYGLQKYPPYEWIILNIFQGNQKLCHTMLSIMLQTFILQILLK